MLAPFEHSMEVDMHPPPRRSVRTKSGKRPRSPPSSPSTSERPRKRPSSCSVTNTLSRPLVNSTCGPAYAVPHNISRCYDDWVSRTQGLSIDKECAVTDELIALTSVEVVDENMTMENDECISHPCPPPNSPMHFSVDDPLQPYLSHTISHSPLQYLTPPDQLPLLPSPVFIAPQPQHHGLFTPQDTIVCSSSAPASDSTINAPLEQVLSPPPIPTRKQRFTMGPRADCEKCRLGVPGHWMHLD